MGLWNNLKKILNSDNKTEEICLDKIQDIIGYHFHDSELLLLSLTHRSYSYSKSQKNHSNERLEFLGDSVLGLIIAEQLFNDHPDLDEGELTKTKALLVSETTLAELAIESGLNQHLLLATEEDRSGGRERPSIVSDAFESILGAVFLDGGLDAARDVVLRLIYVYKDKILSDSSRRNFKGELLEQIQAQGNGMPRYDVISEEGPDHAKVFSVEVNVGGEIIGHGKGNSKKEAEQKAASDALENDK
jgi:ribonuclease III